MKISLISSLLIVLFGIQIQNSSAQNADLNSWTQFRGNERNGISSQTDLLEKWPENGPELVWKAKIGTSFSELLISNDKIYTMSGEQIDSTSGDEYANVFDAATGVEIWKTKLDSIFIDIDGWGNGARSTPVVDHEKMYCLTSYGKLIALSIADGKIQWTVDFVKEYGSTVPRWGFSTSPILIDGVLVVEVGGKDDHAFMGFDPENGKQLWANSKGQSSYCSPVMAEIGGQRQIIFANGNMLYAFNAEGESLWSYKMSLRSPTATPVFIAPDKVFVSSVSSTGCFVVQITNNEVTEIMNNASMQNHWSSCCYYNGHLYGFNVAALQCISVEDGTKTWTKRGYGKGSLILVGDKLLVLSDKGKLILVQTNSEEYTELSSFQALEGKSWTAPSYANGKIYLRNLTEMACYKLK